MSFKNITTQNKRFHEILQEFLKLHLRFEERVFYPRLDKLLDKPEIEKLTKEISRRMSKIRNAFFN